MKLINKLTLGHLIVGLFVIVVALVGMETINNIDFAFSEISEQTLPVIEALEDARAGGLKIGSSTSEFVFLRAESKSNLTGLDIEKENIILAIKRYDVAISHYEELVNKFFPGEKNLAENVKNSGKKLQNASNELITLKEQGASGSIVLEKWDEFEAAEQEFLKAIDGAIAHESEEIAQRKQFVENAIATSIKTILIAGLLTFIIAIVLGTRISKSISDPITKLKNAAIDLGKGKLDTRVDIKSMDEVGVLAACFNQMAERLEQGLEERKRAEEALKESEERYRRLVEFSPYGIAIHSEGKFVFINQAGAGILGAANPEEVIGIPVLQIIHPDYRELVKERIRMQEEGKAAPLIEEKLLRLDGTSVDVEITSIPFTYKGKLAMYGVFLDITERKLAVNGLKESEERYRRLVDFSPYGIAIHSEGKFVFINQAGARILGAANPEELIGIPVLQIIHLDYRELVKERIRMQEEGKAAPLIEEKLLRLDGTSVDVELTSIPFTYKGKPAMYGVFLDITERKRAEEKLQESEKRFRAAFDFSGSGMAIVSTDGHWLRVNKNLCKIVGYSEDELLKTTFQAITHPDDLPKNIESQHQLLAGEIQYVQAEKRYRQRDGHYVWVLMTTSMVRSEQGKPLYFVTQVVDINEHKLAEELRLENERLVLANQAKSEFLAVMSHELRTPLNAVIGFSELLKRGMAGELNKKQGHYVDNVLVSGKHLLTLISDLLDIARVEAGKMELVIEKISVPEVLNETIAFIKENATKRNVILKKDFDPQLDVIEADRIKFKQILYNLLDNAVKFGKPEGGTVTITTEKSEDLAKISVSDTGIGIKEKDMGKLFTMFQQIDSGISRTHGGAGLGLAISKKFVELHGGKIMVESKYGEGSTFTFLIPLVAKKGGENK